MSDIHTTTVLDDLIDGRHEKCAWCKAPFILQNGRLQRHKALDGKWYCSAEHATAPYIQEKWNGKVLQLWR